MKKSKILIIICVMLMILSAGLLTSCNTPIDHEVAFKQLKECYEKSIGYDIFFSKEVKSDNTTKIITNVNSVCTLNKKNEYQKDSNGAYKDHAVSIYREIDSKTQFEIMVGLSKDGKKDPGRYLKFDRVFTGKYTKDKKGKDDEQIFTYQYSAMTPTEYIKTAEFEPHKLLNKFAELGRLERADVIFDAKGASKTGELTTLKFKLTDAYYQTYLADMGVESILKGTYITMELVYGRIANITVMQEEAGTESIFGVSEYEKYKIEVVYLGPIIKNIPNYNEKNDDKILVWTERK